MKPLNTPDNTNLVSVGKAPRAYREAKDNLVMRRSDREVEIIKHSRAKGRDKHKAEDVMRFFEWLEMRFSDESPLAGTALCHTCYIYCLLGLIFHCRASGN